MLSEIGFEGLEVAPSRIWPNTWEKLSLRQVDAYRHEIEACGLSVVGLHSLFFDQPLLGMFKNSNVRAKSLDFLVHLSSVCRDLGGHTLIYGSGRKRGILDQKDALNIAISFVEEYVRKTEDHGTCLCFEPLGKKDTDFINSVYDAKAIVTQINHPALKIQIDAKALVENNEVSSDVFEDCANQLVHYHANEPGLTELGQSGLVDHRFLGAQLRRIRYDRFVSVEQRMLEADDPMKNIYKSMSVLQRFYKY
ncbi:MAG: hypothetical protein CMF69_06565 [Magnetovibrio sp.]|nr:hypothetical protein [Magnetovibrio sp.]|tara:strand:- start:3747 stop:4499 length:753 start_codon:yes stop_codon:yes gene_type:complete